MITPPPRQYSPFTLYNAKICPGVTAFSIPSSPMISSTIGEIKIKMLEVKIGVKYKRREKNTANL